MPENYGLGDKAVKGSILSHFILPGYHMDPS
jgi:hypothetical protein